MLKQLSIPATAFLLGALLFMATSCNTAGPKRNIDTTIPEPSLEGKNVLFVHGGWDGHDPLPSRDLFVPWMKSEGARVIVSDSLGVYTDEALMDTIDLIVQIWTM